MHPFRPARHRVRRCSRTVVTTRHSAKDTGGIDPVNAALPFGSPMACVRPVPSLCHDAAPPDGLRRIGTAHDGFRLPAKKKGKPAKVSPLLMFCRTDPASSNLFTRSN